MGKHWARQQIRQDEMRDTLEKGVAWVDANRPVALKAAGAAAAVLVALGLVAYRWHANRADAWDRLALAEAAAYAGGADASLQQLGRLDAEHPGSEAAGFGLLFAGDVLYPRARYKEAAERYRQLLDRGQPKSLIPIALSDLAVAQEAADQCADAAGSARRFLDEYSDHFLAPQVHASLARCLEAQGKTDEAKAALQKIALQYPDTSFAAWAQARLQGK